MFNINLENKKIYWFTYTFLFILFAGFIFLSFILKGNSFVRAADGFDQTYPVLVYIGEYLRDVLRNGFPIKQYDFSLGFGESIITSISWLGFGDIFTIFSVFVPKEYTEYLFDFIILLKLYFSGITFSCYCIYHNKKKKYILTGALFYAFSRFSTILGLEFYQFLNPVVWLPLLFLYIDKIIYKGNKKRDIFAFSVVIFLQAINGFYFLYIETVLCVVYFFVRYFTRKQKKSFRDFIITGLCVGGQYIIGVGMGAFVFLPAVIGYFGSTKTGMNVPSFGEYLIYPASYYLQFFQRLFIPEAWENGLGVLFLLLPCLFVLFGKRSGNLFLKLLVVLTLCAYLTPLTGSVLNGFSYSSDRWYFVIYFVMALIYVDAFQQGIRLGKKQILISFTISFGSVLAHCFLHELNKGLFIRIALYSIIFLTTYVILYKASARKKERCLLIILLLNILLNGFMMNAPVIIGGGGYSAGFSKHGELYDEIANSQAKDYKVAGSLGRLDIHDSSRGSAMVLDYNGTSEYFSIINKNISEFFLEMAVSPGIISAANALEGLDSRGVLESLLSVEYFQDSSLGQDGVPVEFVKKNNYILPFGFTYSSYLLRSNVERMNEVEKMDALMKCIVLEEELEGYDQAEIDSHNVKRINNTVEYINVTKKDNSIYVNEKSSINVILSDVLPWERGELYIKINNLKLYESLTKDILVENKKIQVRNCNSTYYIGRDDFLVHVEIPYDNIINITFEEEGSFEIGTIETFWYSMEEFENMYEALSQDVMEDVKVETNKITGNISLDEDKILFLSIPFDSSWKAEVDGVPVKTYRANIGFTGIPVSEGQHRIELKFTTPGVKIGGLISICCIILLVVWLFVIRERKVKVGRR